VYLAQPPLYRIDVGKEVHWALDEEQRERIVREGSKGKRQPKIEIQRFKGLGEMMPKTLKETTLDPKTRHLLKVVIPDSERLSTEETISDLMGKHASARYDFIMEYAIEAEDLDF